MSNVIFSCTCITQFISSCQVDKVSDPEKIKAEAERRGNVVCLSALNGDGLDDFCNAIQENLKVGSIPYYSV